MDCPGPQGALHTSRVRERAQCRDGGWAGGESAWGCFWSSEARNQAATRATLGREGGPLWGWAAAHLPGYNALPPPLLAGAQPQAPPFPHQCASQVDGWSGPHEHTQTCRHTHTHTHTHAPAHTHAHAQATPALCAGAPFPACPSPRSTGHQLTSSMSTSPSAVPTSSFSRRSLASGVTQLWHLGWAGEGWGPGVWARVWVMVSVRVGLWRGGRLRRWDGRRTER